jgi:hypothetical protein
MTRFNSVIATPPSTPPRAPLGSPQKTQAKKIDLSTPLRAFRNTEPYGLLGVIQVRPLSMQDAYRFERIPRIHPCPRLVSDAKDVLRSQGNANPTEEEVINKITSEPILPSSKVEYLDEPSHLRLSFLNGNAVWKGKVIGSKENRQDEDFHPKLIYVVDQKHQFYCHGIRYEKVLLQKKNFHHSSFFGSGRVQAAGEMSISPQGKISMISNSSGHYKPTIQHLVYAVQLLKRDMLEQDFSVLKVEFFDENGNENSLLAPQFLREKLTEFSADLNSKKRKYA